MLELIQDSLKCGELRLVPGRRVLTNRWRLAKHSNGMLITYLIDLRIEGIKIHEQVDASLCKSTHASTMVTGGIDMIYADGIGPQLLHRGCITGALVLIQERV